MSISFFNSLESSQKSTKIPMICVIFSNIFPLQNNLKGRKIVIEISSTKSFLHSLYGLKITLLFKLLRWLQAPSSTHYCLKVSFYKYLWLEDTVWSLLWHGLFHTRGVAMFQYSCTVKNLHHSPAARAENYLHLLYTRIETFSIETFVCKSPYQLRDQTVKTHF